MPIKGGRRKKTRTHVSAAEVSDPNAAKVPKSFVVKSGVVGGSVSGLVRDIRKVLEPNTGTRIRASPFFSSSAAAFFSKRDGAALEQLWHGPSCF